MLDIVNNHNSGTGEDWHTCWQESSERQAVEKHIGQLHAEKGPSNTEQKEDDSSSEFAAPFITQLQYVTVRIFQQYWRMPSYVSAKWVLAIAAGLFIGFSFFKPDQNLAGMSIVLFGVFMISTIFTTLVNQVSPARRPSSAIPFSNHDLNRFNRCLLPSVSSTRSVSGPARHTHGKPLSSPTSLSNSLIRLLLEFCSLPVSTTPWLASKAPIARAWCSSSSFNSSSTPAQSPT